jgi:DNA-binding transcriptional MocR family regulator
MWRPRLDRKSGPLYLALANSIADDIQAGRLTAGDRLPPQRDLADLLGLNVTTVTRGYTEADRRGLVRGEIGRGTFVRPPAFAVPHIQAAGLIDLGTNALLPLAHAGELASALAALVSRTAPDQLFNYQPHAGRLEHRAACAVYLRQARVPAETADTIITSGAQHAMAVALATLSAPGESVLCEALTYTGMRSLANHLHVKPHAVPMDGEGLIPDALEDAALESGARVLYCMPSVQNPTGGIMSRKRRHELARVASRRNLFILEDDTYGFLAEGQEPIASLVPERTFYITSLSKSLVPGLRVGLLRTPPGWLDRVVGAVFATTVTVTPLAAAAAVEWIENGTADRVAEWKRDEVKARQQITRAVLGDAVTGAPESQHVWLQLPRHWPADDFTREARQRGVVITSGREFAVARHDVPSAVRVCLGPPGERQSLKRGLTTLSEILKDTPQAFGTSV